MNRYTNISKKVKTVYVIHAWLLGRLPSKCDLWLLSSQLPSPDLACELNFTLLFVYHVAFYYIIAE